MNETSTVSAASTCDNSNRNNAEDDTPHLETETNCTTDQIRNLNSNSNSNQQRSQGISSPSDRELNGSSSQGMTTPAGEEDQPIENIREELESDAFKKLACNRKPLPVSLQSQALEWTKKLLLLKDKVQTKKHSLQKLIQSPNLQSQQSSNSNCEPRNVYRKCTKIDSLHNACNNRKNQFAEFMKNCIVKVADLETSIAKINLAEELLKAMVTFCESLICSKLARPNLTPEVISAINSRS